MPPLQVRDCPDTVYEQLRICAAEENRSISSQVLTILEDYLAAREADQLEARYVPGRKRMAFVRRVDNSDNVDYGERRRKVFERIESHPPIPISEDRPRADILLAQIREEEAK